MIEQLNRALDELTREIQRLTPKVQKYFNLDACWTRDELVAARAMLRRVIEKVERVMEV